VSLVDFIGFHIEAVRKGLVSNLCEDALYVRIVKRKELKVNSAEFKGEEKDEEEKVTKLGVGVDGGFQSEEEKYVTLSEYSIVAMSPKGEILVDLPYNDETKKDFPMQVSSSADAIVSHTGLVMQQDVKEWELDEEPKPVSKYCEQLEFVDNGVVINPDPSSWKCEKSGDTENLWLNLSDGFIGGGRKFWDGSGGSNGALDHFHETGDKYPLVVKLGTITADVNTADCYSYAKDEDGPVKIPNLADLLDKRGILVAAMKKTDKSLAEMEVELNSSYAFDAITEESHALIPTSGPGLQGLKNLGNSCYINSVVQVLFSGAVPELSSRYGVEANGDIFTQSLLKSNSKDAPSDLLCQTSKLACALTSGAFIRESTDFELNLEPKMFKHCVGGKHPEFKTGQQQDAQEYFEYFLESLDRAEKEAGTRIVNKADRSGDIPLSSSLFSFQTVDRIACSSDRHVKYRDSAIERTFKLPIPVKISKLDAEMPDVKRQKAEIEAATKKEEEIPNITFEDCLTEWLKVSSIDNFRWPHLQNAVHPTTVTTRLKNFPRYLAVQAQRYTVGDDWIPKKLEIKLKVKEEIDISSLKSCGPQHDEVVLNDDQEEKPTLSEDTGPAIDEGSLAQLMDMGFSMNGCMRALNKVGGSDVEAAMTWIFEHSQDPDFNDPLPTSEKSSNDGIDDSVVMSLVESLGCFTIDQVKAALKATNNAPDRAADWLFTHMVGSFH